MGNETEVLCIQCFDKWSYISITLRNHLEKRSFMFALQSFRCSLSFARETTRPIPQANSRLVVPIHHVQFAVLRDQQAEAVRLLEEGMGFAQHDQRLED